MNINKLPASIAAALLVLLSTSAVAAVAVIQPDSAWSAAQKESNYNLTCGSGKVMVGREHKGDENGDTKHLCATVTQEQQLQTFNESEVKVGKHEIAKCPFPKVMTGRGREGDENSDYWIHCAEVRDTEDDPLVPTQTSNPKDKESAHTVECGKNEVMSGMSHTGDENGQTEYYCSKLF